MDIEEDNNRTEESGAKSSLTVPGSSTESSNKDSTNAVGRSRRKQTKTRRHVSDTDNEDDEVVGTVESLSAQQPKQVESGKSDAPSTPVKKQEEKIESKELSEELAKTVQEDKGKKSSVTDDSAEVLPEGTVIVHPEPVDDSRRQKIMSRKSLAGSVLENDLECTACRVEIPVKRDAIYKHPVLKVLLCKKCYIFHTTRTIEPGEDGSDESCRWCTEGGDLICCDYCHNAFCKMCVRRNMGRSALNDILNADEGAKWHCYVCDPRPLTRHIDLCTQVMQAMEEYLSQLRPASHHKRVSLAQTKPGTPGSTSTSHKKKSPSSAQTSSTKQKKLLKTDDSPDALKVTTTKAKQIPKSGPGSDKTTPKAKTSVSAAGDKSAKGEKIVSKTKKSEAEVDEEKPVKGEKVGIKGKKASSVSDEEEKLKGEKLVSKSKKAGSGSDEEKSMKSEIVKKILAGQKKDFNESMSGKTKAISGAIERMTDSKAEPSAQKNCSSY